MSYFPVFLELEGKRCLVAGGGRVALRKVSALREFGAAVLVVAPEILPEIQNMEGVLFHRRQFEEQDLNGQTLVVAATGDAAANRRISELCRKAGILVNAVDQTEDCDFIFPAYLKEGEVVAAFSSGGQSPVIAQYLKEQTRPVLSPVLGEIAACLGIVRKLAREYAGTKNARKQMYREILQLGIERDAVPSQSEIEEIVNRYKGL